LRSLVKLQGLQLASTRVTDLSPLSGMRDLRFLDLGDVPVADVTPLSGLMELREIDLRGTKITDLSPLVALTGCAIITAANPRRRRRTA